MQNTNTNPVSNTVSSLQKEKTVVKASVPVSVRSIAPESSGTRIRETAWQKIKKFLLGLFCSKTHKLQKADSKIIFAGTAMEQKRTTHKDEQTKISVGTVVSTQLAKAPTPAAQDTLRKMAEQQFMTMDTSQATRN